jgi:hypothetical protein
MNRPFWSALNAKVLHTFDWLTKLCNQIGLLETTGTIGTLKHIFYLSERGSIPLKKFLCLIQREREIKRERERVHNKTARGKM